MPAKRPAGLTMLVPSGMLIRAMPRRGPGRRLAALVAVVLGLLAFGAGLVSPCLSADPGNPAYYDGDEDDVGIVQERFSWTPVVEVASVAPAVSPVAIPPVSRLEPPEEAAGPAPVAERGHPTRRAPPVSRA